MQVVSNALPKNADITALAAMHHTIALTVYSRKSDSTENSTDVGETDSRRISNVRAGQFL